MSPLPARIRFDGRILFLSADPDAVSRQLAGEDLALETALPLRADVSTDEITPSRFCFHHDERIARFAYVGLRCGEQFPVGAGAVQGGGFAVVVSGRRHGKGSSREHSPLAERAAGVRLVIAASFERIYRQNCVNLGILTSTDPGLVARIRAGEAIPLDEFLDGHDPLTREVVRAGGLAAFARARHDGTTRIAVPRHGPRPMTYAEKLVARATVAPDGSLGVESVRPGDGVLARADWRYAHEYLSPLAASLFEAAAGADVPVRDPRSVVCFQEHLVFDRWAGGEGGLDPARRDAARALGAAQARFCARHGIRLHAAYSDRDGAEGICHSLMAERYALPGQVVVGTDSHTTHVGALGCLAFGVGASDMAAAWLTGEVRVTVPGTCRVVLRGRLPEGVAAKDLVLHILGLPGVREGRAVGQVIEYAGEALASMDTDERATLTNMAAEIGGFTGIVAPDAETVAFVRERRGVAITLEPWMASDTDAAFAQVIEVDCSALAPMVAGPGDPGNGLRLDALGEPVGIDVAYGGSCSGAKREDLVRYHEVIAWGLARGMRVAPGVRFFLQFGSADVRDFCARAGMLDAFRAAGVELLEPGCGACVGAGPGSSIRAGQVTVSAQNRNFPGRSGPGQVWLASPATVAASALAGRLVSFAGLRRDGVTVIPPATRLS
jgi:3-isopropylmalate/(R)-2-methylmalate dehydratase large subunit